MQIRNVQEIVTVLISSEYHMNPLKENKERETITCDLASITTNIFISPTLISFHQVLIYVFIYFLPAFWTQLFAGFPVTITGYYYLGHIVSFLVRVQIS